MGKFVFFRAADNAERMQDTCRGLLMPELPTDRFVEAIKKVVQLNERFIPPYETGATLYIASIAYWYRRTSRRASC